MKIFEELKKFFNPKLSIVPDQTSVWGTLSTTNPQGNGLVFIDPSTFQPVTSVNDFAAKTAFNAFGGGSIYFGNSGDHTGTDAVNAGGQLDSYVPTTLQNPAVLGMIPGHTVSVSRGTRSIPTVALDGDLAGEFSGYGLQGAAAPLAYSRTSGIMHYVSGAHATNPGGKMHFGTKQNNGAYTDWLALRETGVFTSLIAVVLTAAAPPSVVRLGQAGYGFGALTLDYTITATVGAVTINKPCGRVIVGAGTASIVVTNSLVTANSIILANAAQVDAGNRVIRSIVAGAGSFTITLDGNVTADQAYNFLVVNTDS